MTCIVGIAMADGTVYIGGDSCAASGWDYFTIKSKKVFRIGQFLIGYTSSFRMGQILQYHLSIEPQQNGETNQAYMIKSFIESVRDCLKQFGYTKVENNQEEIGEFLVGYRGGLYNVSSDLQVLEPINSMAACGCGAAYALGAMAALVGIEPNLRIIRALEISETFCSAVRSPFYVDNLP